MYLLEVICIGHLEASRDALVKKAVKSTGSTSRTFCCSAISQEDSVLVDRQENGGVLLLGFLRWLQREAKGKACLS